MSYLNSVDAHESVCFCNWEEVTSHMSAILLWYSLNVILDVPWDVHTLNLDGTLKAYMHLIKGLPLGNYFALQVNCAL